MRPPGYVWAKGLAVGAAAHAEVTRHPFCGCFYEAQTTTVRASHSRKPAVPLIPVIDHLATVEVRHEAKPLARRAHDVASLRDLLA